ncbi:NAD(P)-dependent oxidoreductase [Galbitalea sp. SE-J8]|uniref:NAD(P)-dependent oxidoreductase n=1 Tax=Galbitalea sp. SE-J8 TaxID=3054952 RepID=UPI00259D30E0|nr:NAD(P)-dependent oxidoreductase [Galbitalea sp. SE-J8]MDM4762798.1 NAD(P)-dependent oxidoreductase [Galbitalea sp. SE-J8]
MTIDPNGGVERPRVGVIGLGAMGRPMAHALLRSFGALSVTARRPSAADDLVEAGADWRDSPADLAAASDVVLLMLPDLPQVRAVLDGDDGILASTGAHPLLLVIGSTSDPDGVRALARETDERTAGRIRLIDAPVSGGEEGARDASLAVFVGGADDDVERAWPVLRAVGHPEHLGPLGAGQIAKACNQLIVAATIMALGEAAVLAERGGLDVETLFALLGRGYAGSRVLATRGARMAERDYRPSGAAVYLRKDLRIAEASARERGVDGALISALRARVEQLVDDGLGDDDIAVARLFVERRSVVARSTPHPHPPKEKHT